MCYLINKYPPEVASKEPIASKEAIASKESLTSNEPITSKEPVTSNEPIASNPEDPKQAQALASATTSPFPQIQPEPIPSN